MDRAPPREQTCGKVFPAALLEYAASGHERWPAAGGLLPVVLLQSTTVALHDPDFADLGGKDMAVEWNPVHRLARGRRSHRGQSSLGQSGAQRARPQQPDAVVRLLPVHQARSWGFRRAPGLRIGPVPAPLQHREQRERALTSASSKRPTDPEPSIPTPPPNPTGEPKGPGIHLHRLLHRDRFLRREVPGVHDGQGDEQAVRPVGEGRALTGYSAHDAGPWSEQALILETSRGLKTPSLGLGVEPVTASSARSRRGSWS